jgi:hypothetical protein
MLTAKERWERLQSKRNAVLERARDCAALTIPALVPPEGHDDNNVLPTPYQSLGARGVNNVASKLLMSLFPPGAAFLRLQVDAKTKVDLGKKVQEVEELLAEHEKLISNKIETMAARPTLFEIFKHLVAAGNALMHMKDGTMRMFRIDQYVVSRRADGKPVEAVIKECVIASTLSPEIKAACNLVDKKDEKIDVYTVIEWGELYTTDWQEINGVRVPDSLTIMPRKKAGWFALRWVAVPGQDYGRGLVEEYLGDVRSLEGLSESLVRFAAAASKILFMVKPGTTTRFEDIRDAESGDAIVGNKADVDVLQIEKFNDFQVTKAAADGLETRLSQSFLLRSGTTRQAERVTAEEIRATAQELEDVLGGVYTVQAIELQLPLARYLIADMTKKREIPALPEKVVQPIIITGFEALGRNHGVNRLRAWIGDVKAANPDGGASTLNWREIDKALGIGHGVENLDSFILTEDEIADINQQQRLTELAAPAIGPVAGAVAKNMSGPQA